MVAPASARLTARVLRRPWADLLQPALRAAAANHWETYYGTGTDGGIPHGRGADLFQRGGDHGTTVIRSSLIEGVQMAEIRAKLVMAGIRHAEETTAALRGHVNLAINLWSPSNKSAIEYR